MIKRYMPLSILAALMLAHSARAQDANTILNATPGYNLITLGSGEQYVDNNISITGSATNISGATVSISSGMQPTDELHYNSLVANGLGISGSFNFGTGVLTLSGSASPAAYEFVLRSVSFITNSPATTDRVITFTLGDMLSFSNGHYYEFVPGALTWTAARNAAAAMNQYGLQGYLATVTSDAENAFIKQKLSSDGWVGGSDDYAELNAVLGANTFANQAAAEGKWHWVTGPEAGQQFSTDSNSFNGRYENWSTGEPNNSLGTEHFVQFYASSINPGDWNDVPNTSTYGYIVEYGGMAGDPALQLSQSRTLKVQSVAISGAANAGLYRRFEPAQVVDANLELIAATAVTDVRVTISSGFDTGDVLGYTGSLPAGVSAAYDNASGVLSFTGTAPAVDWRSLLRTVTFYSTANTIQNRQITFSIGNLIAGSNGHFYEFIATPLSWNDARLDAASSSYLGLQGYLATITSQAENDFIRQKLTADGWIGASDEFSMINTATGTATYADQAAAEGKWFWISGPEAGQQFSTIAAPFNNMYENWSSGEPNNIGGEHYGQILSTGGTVPGAWNDLPASSTMGYVVEYGGMANDPVTTLFHTTTLQMNWPLPVDILSFEARARETSVDLSWQTANERDIARFELERSTDGLNYQPLNQHAPKGASVYTSADLQPVAGISYYRLKVLNLDGSHAYAPVASVLFRGHSSLMVYPSPATDRLHLTISQGAKAASVQIINLAGQTVASHDLLPGQNSIAISQLIPGRYQLVLTQGTERMVCSFIKQ